MTPARGRTISSLASPRPVTVFVGNFGSGKTEIALNYAISLATRGSRVCLVDLDLVNPYFRSREAREFASGRGVEVIAPVNEYAYADLPILLREIAPAIQVRDGYVVLDVGGDDLGARVLGGFAHLLQGDTAEVIQVVNERRPFTDSAAGCRRMHRELEQASRLRITGLVANAHLVNETEIDVVERGVAFTQRMADEIGVPLLFAAVERKLVAAIDEGRLGCPVLALDRFMTAPWERSERRGPIGRPPQTALPAGVK